MNHTPLETDLESRIGQVGNDLRRSITALVEELTGAQNPRPTRLMRVIGLDKSLASRVIRAIQTPSDLELVSIVPSPSGLRILADSATRVVDESLIGPLLAAVTQFEQLLEEIPGGRSGIDARIGEASQAVRSRSEQAARQAAFKSMSHLLGQFCDLLASSLFVVPSANGRTVDAIVFHRRMGLRRMRPSTPLVLFNLNLDPEEPSGDTPRIETLDGSDGVADPSRFLISEASSRPMPEIEILREGRLTTLLMAGDPSAKVPSRLSSAFRIRNCWPLNPETSTMALRSYTLHVPCRRMIRDIYIADPLWPGCAPRITWMLPGPRATTPPPRDSGPRHFTTIPLSGPIEQLPDGPPAFDVPDLADNNWATRYVLDLAGQKTTHFRGWRCAMTYPVPLVEMVWWLTGLPAR